MFTSPIATFSTSSFISTKMSFTVISTKMSFISQKTEVLYQPLSLALLSALPMRFTPE